MGKDMVLTTAGIQAVLGTSWRNNKNTVNTFIQASAGITVPSPTRSWCGDFAYWVLKNSGVSPLPPLAKPVKGGWSTVSRYGETYDTFAPGMDTPQSGDMFYMKYTTHAKKAADKPTNHVGFVVEFEEGSSIFKSVDGNSGGNPAILVVGLGGGYVCYNEREISLVDFFIRIPD